MRQDPAHWRLSQKVQLMNETNGRHVLVVEDDPISSEMLAQCLTAFGYRVTCVDDGRAAIDQIRTGKFRLVVSDWEMPELDGLGLCQFIRQRRTGDYIYVILLTSRSGTSNVVQGLDAGADDFITKPFQQDELHVRLRVAERILSLEGRDLLIFSLAKLADSRDPETGGHLERIRQYSRLLAEQLSRSDQYGEVVDGDFVQMIYLTSPLHDIGKVGIPDDILKKPGPLTPDEYDVMKTHTSIGGETLDAVAQRHRTAGFLTMARNIAWSHHERYDGSGYPRGLAGEEIPLSARIVCLADVYDALTSKRVYKEAFSHDAARDIILEGAGTHFDPEIVKAFLQQESAFIDTCRLLQSSERSLLSEESSLLSS
jgi:putative two-component system response regulator